MQSRKHSWMWLLTLACFACTPWAFAQDSDADDEDEDEEEEVDAEVMEEVIVTGSFIRRDNFDLPSPIHVTDELDLELAGTTDMGDIIFDQTFQFGVNANAAPFEGDASDDQQWNQGAEVWANIRGLGTRATMTMMDSHRLPADTNTWGRRTGVDVSNTYPQIAIGRVETILDGASALYGAEAVAGVINMIPNKNFEGLRVQYTNQRALEKGAPNQNLSVFAGAQGDRTKAIFAMELREVSQMRIVSSRPEYIISVQSPWGNQKPGPAWHDAGDRSNPGDWWIPVRDSMGNLVEDPAPPPAGAQPLYDNLGGIQRQGWGDGNKMADPGCEYGFGAGPNDWGQPEDGVGAWDGNYNYNSLAEYGNFLNGTTEPWEPQACIMTLGDMQDMQDERSNYKGFAYFEHEFNDYVTVRGEIVLAVTDYFTRDVTGGLDELEALMVHQRLPIAIGSNPGNPFRSYAPGSWWDGAEVGNRPSDTSNWSWVHDVYGRNGGNAGRGIFNRVAYIDENGNGLYDYLEEPGELFVFARDDDGDGFPDRTWDGSDEVCTTHTLADGSTTEECLWGTDTSAARQPEARVILLSAYNDSDGDGLPDRYDPDMLENGGLHLYDDVRMVNGELNVNPKQPRNNTVEFLIDDGMLMYPRRAVRDNVRLRLGSTLSIPDTDWLVDFDMVYATGKRQRQYPEPIWWLVVESLRCQGGDEGNSCWNPFSTTYLNTDEYGQFLGDPNNNFPDDDDIGWRPFDDPAVNTEQENRHAGIVLEYNLQTLGMQLVDLVFSNGNLFSLPYNDAPVGFAIGIHHRLETEEYQASVINQTGIGGGNRGLRESGQQSDAIFAELQLPLIQHETWGEMELQIAMRYAEIFTYGKIGQPGSVRFDTTIPKVALRYSPFEWLAFRTSLTEGFVTPGLYALFGEPGQYGGQRTRPTRSGQSVSDYLCDEMPELAATSDCDSAGFGAVKNNVETVSGPNSALGAEYSDLWNAGVSFRLLDGTLVIDLDFSSVRFNGKAEQLSASDHVNINRVGFEDFMLAQCPGTVLDWDNATDVPEEEYPQFYEVPEGAPPEASILITPFRYIEKFPEDAACRLNAAMQWIQSGANNGQGESGLGDSRIIRGAGDNGLGLTLVDMPWLQNGTQETETMIYALNYSFDAEDIPFIGGDYGSFAFSLSSTQMIKMSNQAFACGSGHIYSCITVDGVGNRNQSGSLSDGTGQDIWQTLPPTPEWRVNLGLRWFKDNHTLSVSGRWHDEVTDINPAWDELREAGLLSAAQAAREERDICAWPMTNRLCRIQSQHYWDVSYSYRVPDLFSFSEVSLNVAVRNIFDTYPTPHNRAAGHEPYLDNIFGRIGFASLNFTF